MRNRRADGDRRMNLNEVFAPPSAFPPGRCNAITDVAGVRVGHVTRIDGDDIRTGATAILPHGGNLLQDRVPAGLSVFNGHGKMIGATQILELGEIETPIVLTNTLAAARAAEAILDWIMAWPGNECARSINPIVGETNDGRLNAIHRRALSVAEIRSAIDAASGGPVSEGCIGAGTGTIAMGWKAGIGTTSRVLPQKLGGYTLGVLVQSNFPGSVRIGGVAIGRLLGIPPAVTLAGDELTSGSIMIVVATDAPLSDRNLTRLARRAFAGVARTGASFSNGSGDYAVAFSTAESVRRTPKRRAAPSPVHDLPNERVSPLFEAAIEATEEAVINSLLCATTMTGRGGLTVEALPIDQVTEILRDRGVLDAEPTT